MKIKMTLLVFMLVLPLGARGQSLFDSPHAETRLWCPADIEAFYAELQANLQRETRPENPGEVDEERLYRRDGMEYRGDPESLRRTGYHILRNWPDARKGVRLVMANGGKNANGMALHGYDLLVAVWRQIVRERDNLRRVLWGISHILPTESEVEASREAALSRYRDKWGDDPSDAPPADQDSFVGDLPEECDCRWFLAISYEAENVLYKAILIKSGTIFEDWDSGNTRLESHLAGSESRLMAAYPTNIIFMIRRGDTRIQYSTYLYLSKEPDPRFASFNNASEWKFIRIEPLPYTATGTGPHVRFELEYPLWDEENKEWLWADAVLSSSPSRLWNEMEQELPAGREKLGYGKKMREWAGAYTPEDQLK